MLPWLIQSLLLVLQFALAVCLYKMLGVGWALAAYIAVCGASALCGCYLLHTSKTNSVTWKNRVAGWLLPWSLIVGGGSLQHLTIKNALAASMFGIAVILWQHTAKPTVPTVDNGAGETTLTTTSTWAHTLVDGGILLGCFILLLGWGLLLRAQLKHTSEPITTLIMHRRQAWPLITPPCAIGLSLVLRSLDFSWWALICVWGPLLFILMPVILMMLVLIGHTILGKPMRWN
jgi:hypothetical protein